MSLFLILAYGLFCSLKSLRTLKTLWSLSILIFFYCGTTRNRALQSNNRQNVVAETPGLYSRRHQKRDPNGSLFYCGATRNRTGDTRIFSPLLYQLSYGTSPFLTKSGCKGTTIFAYTQIFLHFFCKKQSFPCFCD